MNLFELQVIITGAFLLWMEVFNLNTHLKHLLGYKKWADKADLPFFWRWLSCYFCTSFWVGFVGASAYCYLTQDFTKAIVLIFLNLIVSRIIDRLINTKTK